jgi:PTH1 family peptidyl-tRNA hydrolase
MRIVLGLGNPGPTYANTRHNAGVLLVEYLSRQLESSYGWRKNFGAEIFKTQEVILVKTRDVFMNESNRLLQGLPEGELWVVHDDLDIRLGEYKVQMGRGPKEHNGVLAVERSYGKEFMRVRIGIDNRTFNMGISGEEYVLGKFSLEERKVLDEVLGKCANEILKTNS